MTHPQSVSTWHHAPMHKLIDAGTYMVTGGTYLKAHRLKPNHRREYFLQKLFEFVDEWLATASMGNPQ